MTPERRFTVKYGRVGTDRHYKHAAVIRSLTDAKQLASSWDTEWDNAVWRGWVEDETGKVVYGEPVKAAA